MSFGFSLSDGFSIIQLAWSTYEGAKSACSEHDGLTREMHTLWNVLSRLQSEVKNPDSLIHRARKSRQKELKRHIAGCEEHLRRIEAILKKYNSLAEEEKSATQLWDRVRFSRGGPLQNVLEIRQKISTYTTAISMSLHLLAQGSQGRVEKMISHQRGELKGIRESINLLIAKSSISSSGSAHEGSIISAYSDDEKWWREFRRELEKSGYKSKALKSQKGLILDYVKELNYKGIFEAGIYHASERGGTEEEANRAELTFRNLGDFDTPEGEVNLPTTTPYMIDREYGGRILEAPIPTQAMSVLIRRIGNLEEQLLRSPNLKLEMPEENETRIGESSVPPNMETDIHDRPVSPITEIEDEESPQQDLEKPQLDVAEFLSMIDEGFVQNGEDPLDDEHLNKARKDAFSLLPSDDRKKIITLQDPTEKKYSFPYYMVTKWEGMRYLMTQAFLNIEDLEQRVSKGEYDLIKSDGTVIISQLWETFVEPDLAITLHMWPIDEAPMPALGTNIPPRSSMFPSRGTIPTTIYRPPFIPPRPAIRPARSSISYPASITLSSSGSSTKPSKPTRSFWGFKQRKKKRSRSPLRWMPPPPPVRYNPPLPARSPTPAPAKPSKTSTRENAAKEMKAIEQNPISAFVGETMYPTMNEEGSPIFELE